MSKFIKKADLKFDRGYITDANDETVGLLYKVKDQLECLDRIWQMDEYLSDQLPAIPAPTLLGFVYETYDNAHLWDYPEFPDTPAIDERTKEAIAYIADRDKVEKHEKISILIEWFKDLLDFCAEEKALMVPGNSDRICCASLGNPLELTVDQLMDIFDALAESEYVEIGEGEIGVACYD